MTQQRFEQEAEGLSPRTIWRIGGGVVVASAALVVIAWLLVVPPQLAMRPAPVPSLLEHGLFDQATGESLRASAAQRLERYEWVDHAGRVARIPIERAIDAVVADPKLIGAGSPALVGAGTSVARPQPGGVAAEGGR